MGVKRWLFLTLTGILLTFLGVAILTGFNIFKYFENKLVLITSLLTGFNLYWTHLIIGILIIIAGIVIVGVSLSRISSKISKELLVEEELVDVLYQSKMLEKGPKVVAVGGGTGLANLLRGLKLYTGNITAIVTVADDGGSSGRLRDELGILPPGDIRNCLVALADREPLMEKLFQYRFSAEGNLDGHSFGNLFIASMTEVLGDFEEAIKESSKVLAIKGQVLPASNEDIHLGAVYEDNSVKMGESLIPLQEKKIKEVFLRPADCKPTAASLEAIKDAELIVVGPGSLYTSILPNLLVRGITETIRKSSAIKIYICNVMTQPGETTGYTASDHLRTIYSHIGAGLFDYIVVNREAGDRELARRYEKEGAYPVKVDRQELRRLGVNIIEASLLSTSDYIRHEPAQLAREILKIIEGG